jgi:hypothetical protein
VETSGARKVLKYTDDGLEVFRESAWADGGHFVAPDGEIVDMASDASGRLALAILGYASEPSDADMLLLTADGRIDWTAKSDSFAMARAYACHFTSDDTPLFGVVGGFFAGGYCGLKLDGSDGAVRDRYWQAAEDNTYAHAISADQGSTRVVIGATLDQTGVVCQFPYQGGAPDWRCELGPLGSLYQPPRLALLIHSNGDIYVCGDSEESTGVSLWKIDAADGTLLATYHTGGRSEAIAEGYGNEIVVAGQTALNQDGAIVNVSVFDEDLYFLRGYATPDSTVYAVELVKDHPSLPRCLNPTDGQANVGVTPVLEWIPCVDAESYDVYFNGEYRGNQTAMTFDPGVLDYDTVYTWQVLAHGAHGCSAGSWTFTTKASEQSPDAPFYTAPPNAARAVALDIQLQWKTQADATRYDIYLNGVFQGRQAATVFDPGPLAYDTEYTWRIEAVSHADAVTSGALWEFKTQRQTPSDPPPAPLLLDPQDGGTVWGEVATLTWEAQPDVTGYHVYLGPVTTGAVLVSANQTPAPPAPEAVNLYDAENLRVSETYVWRIESINPSGTTSGPTWTFTVAEEPGE